MTAHTSFASFTLRRRISTSAWSVNVEASASREKYESLPTWISLSRLPVHLLLWLTNGNRARFYPLFVDQRNHCAIGTDDTPLERWHMF
jgi:hypothetical protein